MDRKKIVLIILTSLVLCILGCRQRGINNKEKFNTVIKAIDVLFDIEMPLEIDQMTVFLDGWQGHGFYVYFEIPARYLNQIKTERFGWNEIPEGSREMILSVNSGNSDKSQSGQQNSLHEKANRFFNYAKTVLKIHNNESDRIQWYYYSDGYNKEAPEKTIKMMISEPQNGIIRCYFSDTDIRDYKNQEELYNILKPDTSINCISSAEMRQK